MWRGVELNKLHYSQLPQTFLSSGESVCGAFPGPVCWLGLAAAQFPWDQHAYHLFSGSSSPATGKQVTSQGPGSELTQCLSLLRRSQVGSWKKCMRKGKISCSKCKGYLGQNGTVERQCCAAVLCWRSKCTRSSAMPAWSSTTWHGTRRAEHLARFCLIVKRVNRTWLDVDIFCEP